MPGLCEAIKDNNSILVQELLANGSDPNFWDTVPEEQIFVQWNDRTMNLTEAIRKLVIRGAEAVIGDSYTPLMLSSKLGLTEITKLLLEYNAQVNFQDPAFKNSALILAAQNGHYDIIELLLAHNADIKLQNALECDALFMASQAGHHRIINILASHGSDVNTKRFDGYTPLMIACKFGHVEAVKILLQFGANVDAKRSEGQGDSDLSFSAFDRLFSSPYEWNALRIAFKNNHIEAMKILLANGGSLSFLDWSGLRAYERFTKIMDAALTADILLQIKTPSFLDYYLTIMTDVNGEGLSGAHSLFVEQYKTLDNNSIKIFADRVSHYLTKTMGIYDLKALEKYLTDNIDLYPQEIIRKIQEAITIYKVVDYLIKGEIYNGENLKDLDHTIVNKIYNRFETKILKYGITQHSIETFIKAINHDLLPGALIKKIMILIDISQENLAYFESDLRAIFEGISPMPTTLIEKGLGKGFDIEIYDKNTIRYYQEHPEEKTNTGLYLSNIDIRKLTELFFDLEYQHHEIIINSFKFFDHASYILPSKTKKLLKQVIEIVNSIPTEPETVTIKDFLGADIALTDKTFDESALLGALD